MGEIELDDDWNDWQVGDVVTWDDMSTEETWTITRIDHIHGYVYWQENAEECMTRETNLLRVRFK